MTRAQRIRITDPQKLVLLYERFRDVCVVEKEVWKEVFLPRDVTAGPVLTQLQDRYEVEIDDPQVEAIFDAALRKGRETLGAVIDQYRAHISFWKKVT